VSETHHSQRHCGAHPLCLEGEPLTPTLNDPHFACSIFAPSHSCRHCSVAETPHVLCITMASNKPPSGSIQKNVPTVATPVAVGSKEATNPLEQEKPKVSTTSVVQIYVAVVWIHVLTLFPCSFHKRWLPRRQRWPPSPAQTGKKKSFKRRKELPRSSSPWYVESNHEYSHWYSRLSHIHSFPYSFISSCRSISKRWRFSLARKTR